MQLEQEQTDFESPRPRQTQTLEASRPVYKNYAQEICVIMGLALSTLGFVGFVIDNFFVTNIPNTQNALHLGAGAMALWFGFTKAETARRFALAMGALYGVLGFLGFIFGASGLPAAGPIHQERFLWRPEPTTLELGTLDHTLHLVFAGIFILGALLKFKRYPKI